MEKKPESKSKRGKMIIISLLLILVVILVGVAITQTRVQTRLPERREEAGELIWYEYNEGLDKAKAENKHILIDFYTDWCKWCEVMDDETYGDEAVKEIIQESFVPVKVNTEASDKVTYEGKLITKVQLARVYGVTGYPNTWFLKPEGTPIAPLSGYVEPEPFVDVLNYIKDDIYEEMNFKEYVENKR